MNYETGKSGLDGSSTERRVAIERKDKTRKHEFRSCPAVLMRLDGSYQALCAFDADSGVFVFDHS